MNTIFVKLKAKRHFLLHEHLTADQWFTLSVPESRSDEVFEVPDVAAVHQKITEKILQEVNEPAKYNKLGDKPEDLTFLVASKDAKLRAETERAQRTEERQKQQKKADKLKGNA